MISRHNGVLGTTLDLHVSAGRRSRLVIEQAMLDEIRRLTQVFDVIDHSSELSRYRSGAVDS